MYFKIAQIFMERKKKLDKILFLVFFYILIIPSLMGIEPDVRKKVFWPLELMLPISGSFAEYRNSHLHMGCDFKTYGINGFPVLSVFDGHVYSMSYSEAGYGLSLVMYSPSLNLSARYAHLNDLTGQIDGLEELKHSLLLLGSPSGFSVKTKQGMYPAKGKTRIARSGETGSGVSHLHLELYDSNGYYNPLNFPNYKQNDTTPPVIQSIFIDSDMGDSFSLPAKKKVDGEYEFESQLIKVAGKVKIRVAGFDYMTSRNKNNVYKIVLKDGEKILFEKTLDQMSYKDASNRENLYDINKSSLSPTVYVYNMFHQSKSSYSIDLNDYPEASTINLRVELSDTSGNVSFAPLRIQIGKNDIKGSSQVSRIFSSNDKVISLDYSGARITGDGFIEINKISYLPDEISQPGFIKMSDAYEVKAINFSWKGDARGSFKGEFSNKDEDLYIFDTAFRQWVPLYPKKTNKQFEFNLTRLGIIAVMKDKTPPVINYPYLVNRDFNLPEVRDPRMLEKFYAVYDRGSGISKDIRVLFEGSSYPFEFDKDRGFIKLEIPLILKKYKNFYVIQIQVKDKAGNKSEWFTDIVTL